MKENFRPSLDLVLDHEGGFSDHPDDPGGATMKGVTLATFRRFFGDQRTVEELKAITDDQLATIYKAGYWDKIRGDELPAGVDYAAFDAAVNCGPGRAARWLQGAIGASVDGAVGPRTLGKVKEKPPEATIVAMSDERLAFLRILSTFRVFGKGWTRRVNEVRKHALAMARGEPVHAAGATAAPYTGFATVRAGSKGEWVSRVQEALGVEADGVFGPQTETALKSFQTEQGLEPDGIAGRQTCRALGLIG